MRNEYLIENGLLLDALGIGNKLNTNTSFLFESVMEIHMKIHFQLAQNIV